LRQNGMKVLVRLANTNVLQGMKQAVWKRWTKH
jgi:hypothetical protein